MRYNARQSDNNNSGSSPCCMSTNRPFCRYCGHIDFYCFERHYGMLRGLINMYLPPEHPMIAIWNNRNQNGRRICKKVYLQGQHILLRYSKKPDFGPQLKGCIFVLFVICFKAAISHTAWIVKEKYNSHRQTISRMDSLELRPAAGALWFPREKARRSHSQLLDWKETIPSLWNMGGEMKTVPLLGKSRNQQLFHAAATLLPLETRSLWRFILPVVLNAFNLKGFEGSSLSVLVTKPRGSNNPLPVPLSDIPTNSPLWQWISE